MSQKKSGRRALAEYVEAEAEEYWDDNTDWSDDDNDKSLYHEETYETENQRPPHELTVQINVEEMLQTNQKGKQTIVKAKSHSYCNNAKNDSDNFETRTPDETIDELEAELSRMAAMPRFSTIRSHSFSTLRRLQSPFKLKRANSLTRIAPANKKNSKSAVPSLSCIQSILPPGVIGGVVGPSLRASLIVTVNDKVGNKRAVAVIAWSVSQAASQRSNRHYDLRVIPITGCGETLEASWTTALLLKRQIHACVDQKLPHASNSCSVHERYLELCRLMSANQGTWISMLRRVASASMQDTQWHVSKALGFVGIPYGASLDRFDIFSRYQHEEHVQKQTTLDDDNEVSENRDADCNLCLVCFDLISDDDDPTGVFMLSPCGHRTCPGCWRSYLKSAADDGQGHVLCPAYKCSTKVGLCDAAHILFFQPDQGDEEPEVAQRNRYDAILYDKLVRFEMERFATCQLKAWPCPSPYCNRYLTSQARDDVGQGWSFSKCLCGMNRCTKCAPSGGPAHPGIDCTKYQQMRKAIDSGKLDSELESMKWVLRFSRRCPNCQFAIEKSGGCNHMRCKQCDNYFCWQCGGPGQECNAFFCQKTKKTSEQMPEQDQDLFRLLSQYRRLRQTEGRLKQLQVTVAGNRKGGNESRRQLCLESSLLQVLLWLYSFTNVDLMGNISAKPVAETQAVTSQLELVVHAITLRKFSTEQPAVQISMSVPPSELGFPNVSTETTQKMYQSKRKQQSLLQRHQDKIDLNSFEALKAGFELQVLCGASQEDFERMAQEAVQAGVQQLWKVSVKPSSDPRHLPRRRIRRANEETVGGLNRKAKRSKDPWKIGMRRQSPSEEDESASRWKRDRTRVAQLRQHAIDNRVLTMSAPFWT